MERSITTDLVKEGYLLGQPVHSDIVLLECDLAKVLLNFNAIEEFINIILLLTQLG